MPIYYHFHVESHTESGWSIPAHFEPAEGCFSSAMHTGEFLWLDPGSHLLDLFWGNRALFPMRPEMPADRSGSALFRYLDAIYADNYADAEICWLPYDELLIDSWDIDTVLVRKRVPLRFALLFGDGLQPFPESELLVAGASPELMLQLRKAVLVDEPLDTIFGAYRFKISQLPVDADFDVTWTETISSFMQERIANAFKGLRRYGRDQELRIISSRGR